MKKIAKLLLLVGVFMFASCELDYLDSPNDVTPASADINFLLNRVQLDFATFFSGTQRRGAEVTRIWHQGGNTYEIAHPGTQQNGTWSSAYSSILSDIKAIKGLAEEGGFLRHLAIAKTLEAYVLMVLVDQFGDIPYSEALDPANFNPVADDDAAVYAAALGLIQSARADFAAPLFGSPNDYFYANNATKWQRLLNTLELRYHLALRLTNAAASTAGINALIATNNFLAVGDDFVFSYGRNQADPASRHPQFVGQYPTGGGDYQSTFFMWHVTEGKKPTPGDNSEPRDPRANYYFYRQTGSNPTLSSEKDCITEFPPTHYPSGMPWCLPGVRGYWGRDHMDPDGIPPDGLRRTLYGVYPAGASFDNNTPGAMATAKVGNTGAGIAPIMLAAFVDFMLAEANVTLGTGATPAATLLTNAMTKHINYVRSWSLTTTEAPAITAFQTTAQFDAKRTTYLNTVNAEYAAVGSNTDRLRIIAREYWISLYGNGNEAYNLYRRTGMPDNMQPGQVTTIGDFPRTFFYPNDFVVRNSTVDQKADNNVQVFWDNNPSGFIK